MKKQSGFTLIELLVVIAIISFLSVMGMVIYAEAQAKGRNTQRRADVDSIAKALEIHKTDTGYNHLDVEWFGSSAGLPTTDPQGYKYCIKSNGAGDSIVDATSSTWDDNKDCSDYANVSITTPATGGTDTTWKVCTRLEGVGGAAITYYCRYSVQ